MTRSAHRQTTDKPDRASNQTPSSPKTASPNECKKQTNHHSASPARLSKAHKPTSPPKPNPPRSHPIPRACLSAAESSSTLARPLHYNNPHRPQASKHPYALKPLRPVSNEPLLPTSRHVPSRSIHPPFPFHPVTPTPSSNLRHHPRKRRHNDPASYPSRQSRWVYIPPPKFRSRQSARERQRERDKTRRSNQQPLVITIKTQSQPRRQYFTLSSTQAPQKKQNPPSPKVPGIK